MKQPNPQSSRAVLIGTAKYDYEPDLPAVSRNLTALQQELIEQEVWGLPPQHCMVVENPSAVDAMLDPVYEAGQEAEDVLLVYFAGHALPGSGADLRLCLPQTPKDRTRDDYKTVSYDQLRKVVRGSRAKWRIVILDCCYSGTAIRTMSGSDLSGETVIDGSYTLTSASATAKSLAPEGADFTVFTEELIKVLREGVAGADRLLTLDTVFQQLDTELRAKSHPEPWYQDRNNAQHLPLFKNRAHPNAHTPPGYGEIPGINEGRLFADRRSLHDARVHRPLQAGICGTQKAGGAESIVVSGGYPDDNDQGDVIIYTGHGGQDKKTGRQVEDQKPTDPGNAALLASIVTRYPVRVVRGAGGDPRYSPPAGYSYDGLYTVKSSWAITGMEGFRMLQFRLEKLHDSAPPLVPTGSPADRAGINIARWDEVSQNVYRDLRVVAEVQQAHEYRCQVCQIVMQTAAGLRFTPTTHLKSLAAPHHGPDIPANLVCVCPTHQALLDLGMITIEDDLHLIDEATGEPFGSLQVNAKHTVGMEYVRYHRELYRQR
ncbi:YDG/SRA domain-containing protein [Spirillospora sp. NPDC127200]